ncbi:hypothetical protein ACJW31_11G000100 [Castanea mollissima]
MRLNNLQSSAFKLANYYFVFQGVILTIICTASETTLKKSDRWFLFTLSIIAIVLNLIALIRTGIRYIDTQADYADVRSRIRSTYTLIRSLEDQIDPPDPNIQNPNPSNNQAHAKKIEGYTYLAIYMIFFLGFAAVVLVGCWKFLGTQNDDGFNLPSNDKCIRLCNGAKCLNICSEYRYSSKIQASSMHDKI